MSFTDPQSVTVDGVAASLPRVETAGNKSVYRSADRNKTLTISHQTTAKGRRRRMVRFDIRKIAADPLTAENVYCESSQYFVFDHPEYGFTTDELSDAMAGLFAWAIEANRLKVLGDEH